MIRTATNRDMSRLKQLWQTCFGDSLAHVQQFHAIMGRPEDALIYVQDNTIVSALYLLDAGTFEQEPIAYLYALGTLPEYRGQGFAGKLLHAAKNFARDRGFSAIVLCPETESLFTYYEKFGYQRSFSIAEGTFSKNLTVPKQQLLEPKPCTAAHATFWRREYLGQDAVLYPPRFLRYVQRCASQSGGQLMLLAKESKTIAFAVVELHDNGILVRELLAPPALFQPAVQTILHHFGAPSLTLRCPVQRPLLPGLVTRPFALMLPLVSYLQVAKEGYFPFALD